MANRLDIRAILAQQNEIPLIDVRSEGEFAQGHIPGAISLPLFNNAERAEIGTLYKQQGQQPAILRGLGIVGPKMQQLAEAGLAHARDGRIAVHCWRGGMRSASVAWLFERVGLQVDTLIGGYKAFRRYCHELFAAPWRMIVIGGKTGTRKTEVLHRARELGIQIVDLEAYANHRGSAFGSMSGLVPAVENLLHGVRLDKNHQPTQEHFENLLGYHLHQCDRQKPVLVEDESRLIGRMHIPEAFWAQMRAAPVLVLDTPLEERVRYLTQGYDFPKEKLRQSLTAIRKRLGDERLGRAITALDQGRLDEVCRIALDYYDRAYTFGLSKRDPSTLKVIAGKQALEEILKLGR
ncbi:MAG: tRNA 2-selenouridine(34) synthase MnmH [Turneriella sp.]